MSSLIPAFSKTFLETASGIFELATYGFAFLAAVAGLLYMLANHPLKRIEADDKVIASNRTLALEKDLADAKLALLGQEERTAKAQSDAAQAQAEVLEMKDRAGDRRFTDEQLLRVNARLLGAPNPRPAVQITFVDQGEPKRFAEILAAVLRGANWKADVVPWPKVAAILRTGLWIESRQGEPNSNVLAVSVGTAFAEVGIPVMKGEVQADAAGFPENTILIRVGPKLQ